MPLSSFELTENNLTRTGSFSPATQAPPYNKLYLDIGNTQLSGKKIAFQKANVNYSWPNISSINNTFSIKWPTGAAAYTTVNVTIPVNRNFETVSALNDYLQTVLIANSMYAINATTGDYLYYMSIVANPTAYGISLIQALVPTSTPVGYSTPVGFPGWPSVTRTMQLITDASEFNLLIGYAASTTFNGNTAATIFNSTFCPQLSPVSSVTISCNMASNPLALNNNPNIMYAFTTKDTNFGSFVTVEPYNLVWYNVASNSNLLIVELNDQNGNPVMILDPRMSLLFLISDE